MSEMANDSLLIKSAASERSDGSDVRQKEVCSYVWTSHTHREGTLDSAIRCYHGKHSRGLAFPCGSPWRREKKKNWIFFIFLFFLLHVLFFSFHNLQQGHREVSNIMVQFNQKVRDGEELRRLGVSALSDENWQIVTKRSYFWNILSLYHLKWKHKSFDDVTLSRLQK